MLFCLQIAAVNLEEETTSKMAASSEGEFVGKYTTPIGLTVGI